MAFLFIPKIIIIKTVGMAQYVKMLATKTSKTGIPEYHTKGEN